MLVVIYHLFGLWFSLLTQHFGRVSMIIFYVYCFPCFSGIIYAVVISSDIRELHKTDSVFCYDFCSGVTEEQFKDTWTRPGATDMGDDGSTVIAKSRM